jgi:fido (protein-threonine AMPylation protein)
MAESRKDEPAHRWADIQKLGVLSHVHTIEDYERLIAEGAVLADDYLKDFAPNCFAPGTAEAVHRIMFQDVHDWAGKFRSPGQAVIVSGFPAADHWRVVRELELLQFQIGRFFDFADRSEFSVEQANALVCAFHHLRFERIHPFRDGNGRAGRALVAGAVRMRFDLEPIFEWRQGRERYFEALRAGNNRELSLLGNLILGSLGLEPSISSFRSPFRVGPRMFEAIEETTTEEDLAWSLTGKK